MKPGASLSFELTGKRGAALVTRYPVYREDALEIPVFKEYTNTHYNSWVTFASWYRKVDPVLVYGFDMTKDWAMTAYSNEVSSVSNLSISVPMGTSASAFFKVESSGSPHTKSGPLQRTPPIMPEPTGTGPVPEHYNQCVFLCYCTMCRWMGLFPTAVQAAAGPHNLSPGHNRDDTFPELMAQQDPAPNQQDMSGGEERDLTTEDTHLSVVVYNGPNVWCSS